MGKGGWSEGRKGGVFPRGSCRHPCQGSGSPALRSPDLQGVPWTFSGCLSDWEEGLLLREGQALNRFPPEWQK